MLSLLRPTIFALILTTGAVAQAANIVAQAPCSTTDRTCISFSKNGEVPTIRSFSFNLPAPGRVAVEFNGTLFCQEFFTGPVFVDLISQIVTTETAAPILSGPSSARHGAVLADLGTIASFNLGTTRALNYRTAGQKTVHFKIARNTMGDATCEVFNAAFLVHLFP